MGSTVVISHLRAHIHIQYESIAYWVVLGRRVVWCGVVCRGVSHAADSDGRAAGQH